MKSENKRSQIITFFSYKGGTGRSMALVNSACLLAKRSKEKKGILIIDWDLESPGIHHFISPMTNDNNLSPSEHPGVIDLFISIESTLKDSKFNSSEKVEDLFEKVNVSRYITETNIHNLKLLKAGCVNENYSTKVNSFKWNELYNRAPWLFSSLAQYLSKQYEYILIDSRTGITDTAGICTMLMPEKLVLVFTPNQQSLAGLLDMIPNAIDYRKQSDDLRPLVIFPLPSRIDTSEPTLRNNWRYGNPEKSLKGYQPLFESLFKTEYDLSECNLKRYFDDVQLQHVPAYSYGETIAVNTEKDTKDRLSLSASYDRFVNRLVNLSAPWLDLPSDIDVIDTPHTVSASEKLDDFRQAIKSNSRDSFNIAVDYLKAFIGILEGYRVDPEVEKEIPFDEKIVENINSFRPHRDSFAEFLKIVCLYEDNQKYFSQIFEFFEKAISFMYPSKGVKRWQDRWYDNYNFIIRELFIYLITLCIRYKKYDAIDLFLDEQYYYSTNIDRNYSSFTVFSQPVLTLDDYRNKRLNLKRVSLTADLLKQRAYLTELPFDDIMQTDIILCLRSAFHLEDTHQFWYPITRVYASDYARNGFDIFFKARSKRHFEAIKRLLKVKDKNDLIGKYKSANDRFQFDKPSPDYFRTSFTDLINLNGMDTV